MEERLEFESNKFRYWEDSCEEIHYASGGDAHTNSAPQEDQTCWSCTSKVIRHVSHQRASDHRRQLEDLNQLLLSGC